MKLFRKHCTPEELGARLYEALRAGMASSNDLSLERYVNSLGFSTGDLQDQYVGEVMIGAMFAAIMAIERSTSRWIGEQIRKGMVSDFLRHLKEQGASESQIGEWKTILNIRFDEYQTSLEGYEGLEPPWKLGRQFYWNMIGTEEYQAMSIKISTLYLLEARDAAQELLNLYGPTILVDFAQ